MTDIDSSNPEKTCFVICPIGEPDSEDRTRSNLLLEYVIKPAAKDNHLTALRSDHIAAPGMITTQIIRHILHDKMVVADLSDQNANVFYELALRHAFRKPVVQLIGAPQAIPFDVQGARTVQYTLDLAGATQAKEAVSKQIEAAMAPDTDVESPVTHAARLDELARSTTPQNQVLMQAISDEIEGLKQTVTDMSKLICRPQDFKDAIPPLIKEQVTDILRRYADEIDLLKSVRDAGVIGFFKRRESALRAFSRYIDDESREIVVVGSSLKGLLQNEEYREIMEKLRFKIGLAPIKVKFLLTHPIVADFRASQENRGATEIGLEIIRSLEMLRDWKVDCANVRLYLGAPTCFAIKTTRQMLINPYPYISVSFDSPCLILESPPSGWGRQARLLL
jgi:nucleoside diphosphate kinase